MIEFLVVIPLLALVIAAIYLFAWGLRNAMGLRMSSRYLTWAAVREVPLARRYGITWHDVIMDHLLVRRTVGHIYGNRYRDFDDTAQTMRDLASYVGNYSPEARPVAEELLVRSWQHGEGIRLTATFPMPVGPWQDISGPYKDRYIRDGSQWRCRLPPPPEKDYYSASHEQELTDEFQKELDEALQAVPDESKAIAEVFRELYLETWPRGVPR